MLRRKESLRDSASSQQQQKQALRPTAPVQAKVKICLYLCDSFLWARAYYA